VGYTWTIIIGLAALVFGWIIGYLFRHLQLSQEKKNRQSEIENMLEKANAKAREIELRGRDEALRYRDEAEAEISRKRAELNREEERVQNRREDLDRRLDNIEKRDQILNKRQVLLISVPMNLRKCTVILSLNSSEFPR
jgi:ribonuclease Y